MYTYMYMQQEYMSRLCVVEQYTELKKPAIYTRSDLVTYNLVASFGIESNSILYDTLYVKNTLQLFVM